MRRVRLWPDAEEELLAAVTWYEDKRVGLGVDLIAHVDAALDQIAALPESCPLWQDDRPYRQKVVARFPYVIFFLVESDVVNVVAIAHTKRRPGYWRDR